MLLVMTWRRLLMLHPWRWLADSPMRPLLHVMLLLLLLLLLLCILVLIRHHSAR